MTGIRQRENGDFPFHHAAGHASGVIDVPDVNLDLNGDDDMVDENVVVFSYLFMESPVGLNISQILTNY